MRTWKRPPALALTMTAVILLAIVLFFTRGIGEVMVLAVGPLLIMGHLARRWCTPTRVVSIRATATGWT